MDTPADAERVEPTEDVGRGLPACRVFREGSRLIAEANAHALARVGRVALG